MGFLVTTKRGTYRQSKMYLNHGFCNYQKIERNFEGVQWAKNLLNIVREALTFRDANDDTGETVAI